VRVLITGGAGFIGSHLTDRLIADGHEVVVVDNESTGLRENVPAAARYIKGDVARVTDLDEAFAMRLDAVCHIAGQVSLIRSYTNAAVDLGTNVLGTLNVIQQCLQHRVPRLLYASSMTVYGNTALLPTPEDAPCAPVSYYGITKYAAERYVLTTAERSDLDFALNVTCFRMYNVYGPRQAVDNPYQGVLGIFFGNVLRGEPIVIFGDGRQSRDFIYVQDVVDAWAGALDNPASYGLVFNLGSGRQMTIDDLAQHVIATVGRPDTCSIQYAPARPGEQRHVEADITRARSILGWNPQVSFEAGLLTTAQWARDRAGLNSSIQHGLSRSGIA
jgi:UDP-glucose 4-epimerase